MFALKAAIWTFAFDVSSANQSQLLSNYNTMKYFSISVQIHQTLNTTHSVLSEPELLFPSKIELTQKLKIINVIDGYHIVCASYEARFSDFQCPNFTN